MTEKQKTTQLKGIFSFKIILLFDQKNRFLLLGYGYPGSEHLESYYLPWMCKRRVWQTVSSEVTRMPVQPDKKELNSTVAT